MTTTLRHRLLPPLAAALLTAMPAAATTAATHAAAPFAVTFTDHFAVTPCPPTAPAKALCATGQGRGVAPQLGTATEVVSGTVILAHPDPVTGCAPEFATVRLTAASGQVVLHITGQFCQTSATTSIEVGYYLVTGGTGPFRGASGHGIYEFSGTFKSKMSGTAIHRYRGTFTP